MVRVFNFLLTKQAPAIIAERLNFAGQMVNLFSVRIHDIPAEGVRLATQWDAAALQVLLADVDQVVCAGEPVQLEVSLSRAGSTVVLQGLLRTAVRMACVRCLDECGVAIEGSFRYIFWPNTRRPAQHGHEELRQDDVEIVYMSGDEIDFRPLVREQIVLCLPQYPRCSERCPGLCPQCGAHLKESSCACAAGADRRRSPFSMLEQVKHKH
jgi:uncharacterized protein